MANERISLQPTLRQLLRSEALSEAQVVSGSEYLDRPVSQVVTNLTVGHRTGTLAVTSPDSVHEEAAIKDLSGLVIIRPVSAALAAAGRARTQVGSEVEVENLKRMCLEARIPLVVLAGLGEPVEIAADIRAAYLSEVKKASALLHERLVRATIEEGVDAMLELLSAVISRPAALETSDFQLLGATQNMGPTPANQQKTLTEELAEDLSRELRAADENNDLVEPIRLGRRLVYPVVLEGTVVGYLSIMVRQNDDDLNFTEYLRPAATAALVVFVQRRKGASASALTNRSLLKDLLSGYTLPSAELEQLEQFFGLDMYDGLLVLAVTTSPPTSSGSMSWAGERQAVVEMEGASVFVIPHDSKQQRTPAQAAEELCGQIKHHISGARFVQIGVGRIAETLLDLADGYREARQALVTGSMIHAEKDFVIGYNDLGIKRLLYLVIDHPELDRFYEEHLQPLEDYDTEWETELVPTLKVYLAQGANLNSAAKELFVHRHTMRYRLEQIAELLKVDIDNTEVLLNLQIAFQIKEMKGKAQT